MANPNISGVVKSGDKVIQRTFSVYDTNKRGLCVIIANFIQGENSEMELDGYQNDIDGIKRVFQDEERFDFEVLDKCEDDNGDTVEFCNLNKDQFEKVLGLIQKKINQKGKTKDKYDKFVMFVLSHGNEDGILMYQKDSTPKYQCITDEEIIDHFSHDYVPSLKGVPKCFFFQACRGPGETRAANIGTVNKDNENSPQHHLPLITRANILVAHATLDQKRSYVASRGSVFLSKLIKKLENQDQPKEMFSILTNIVQKVSKKGITQTFSCNGNGILVEIKGEDGFIPTTLIGKE